MNITMPPIGIVKSPVTEPTDEKWGEVISEIHINSEVAAGLTGIDNFSHAIIVYYMHLSTFNNSTDLIRRPQGREDMPLVGIFAQRAKHRPNPIGITSVEIIRVERNIVYVKGLDAIEGTPVLDIKPYFPAFDCRGEAITPEWVERLMKDYF
jgi:tRNA-Thr(GGU) m(6)t(6)A37 methyltransferase TsaA